MNPSSIKKIINKKVTLFVIIHQIPVKNRHSPIYSYDLAINELFLIQIKKLYHETQRLQLFRKDGASPPAWRRIILYPAGRGTPGCNQ